MTGDVGAGRRRHERDLGHDHRKRRRAGCRHGVGSRWRPRFCRWWWRMVGASSSGTRTSRVPSGLRVGIGCKPKPVGLEAGCERWLARSPVENEPLILGAIGARLFVDSLDMAAGNGPRSTQYVVRRLAPMRRFDPKALYAALDAERQSRGVSWKQVAADTGVSGSTISRTQRGGRMEVDGVLALVGWLGVPVESFTRETPF